MIVTILSGGLGNQMFQYAATRALALRCKTDSVFNTRIGFKRDITYHRSYSLDVFCIKNIKNRLLSFDFWGGDIVEKISRRVHFHILCPRYKYFFDTNKNVSSIVNAPEKYKNVILCGYWVNQCFFCDAIPQLRKDFELKTPLPELTQGYISKINDYSGITIAVGVRVYQEIKDEKVRNTGFFYAQSDFFNRAFKYCKEKYGDVRFLIFTQAEEWVRNNVDLSGCNFEFVNTYQEEDKAVFDMYIMSKCNHYIISNSSFYWWGAWLNSNSDKEVIVPKAWTNSALPEWTKL